MFFSLFKRDQSEFIKKLKSENQITNRLNTTFFIAGVIYDYKNGKFYIRSRILDCRVAPKEITDAKVVRFSEDRVYKAFTEQFIGDTSIEGIMWVFERFLIDIGLTNRKDETSMKNLFTHKVMIIIRVPYDQNKKL